MTHPDINPIREHNRHLSATWTVRESYDFYVLLENALKVLNLAVAAKDYDLQQKFGLLIWSLYDS